MKTVNMFNDARIYKHFKGGLYRILCQGKDSETKADMTIYQDIRTGEVWIRSTYSFFKNHTTGERRFTPIDNPVVTEGSQDVDDSEGNAGTG